MQGDTFSNFIQQGPVLRLFMVTLIFGGLWLVLIAWISYRGNERRRRRRDGLPPLPSLWEQIWTLIKNLMDAAAGKQASLNRTPPMALQSAAANGGDNVPLPSVEALTSDLPEPDLESLLMPTANSTAAPLETAVAAGIETDAVEQVVSAATEPPTDDREIEAVGQEPNRNTSGVYVPASGELPSDAVEVMRIWRDVSDGSLIIQMGDKVFQTVPEMRDRGQAKRFIKLVKDLARLAHAGARAAGLAPPNFETSSAVISEQGAWAARRVPAEPVLPTGSEAPESTVPDARAFPEQGEGGQLTIAEQIEELLQFRLTQTPIFHQRSIHLRPNFDGSLRIEVDGRYYEQVGEVVDVDVREFLQSVIREWEARQ